MAKVVLVSATRADDQSEFNLAPVRALQESARADRFQQHFVVEHPHLADVVIFAENYGGGIHFERVRRHPFVRRYRDKCFLFCSNRRVIPFLPGVYASVEKSWASARTCGGFYLALPKNEFTTFTSPDADLPYLFSFMGSIENAAVRHELLRLNHPRGFVQNTSDELTKLMHGEMSARERRDYYRRYAELTKASKFVLCPRGVGAATVRLFETMRMGRVPVILSDGWVAPIGPAWEKFSIQIPEADFEKIPRLLEQQEPNAVAMGMLARREWEQWFSEEVAFHRVVESCLALKKRRRIPEAIGHWLPFLQYARPHHFQRLLRRKWDAFRGRKSEAEAARARLAGSEV